MDMDNVDLWIDRGTEALHSWSIDRVDAPARTLDVAGSAYELLASRGGVGRLCQHHEAMDLARDMDVVIREDVAVLVGLVADLTLLVDWQEDLDAALCWQGLPTAELRQIAQAKKLLSLWEDLDDARLMVSVLEDLMWETTGMEEEVLLDAVEGCFDQIEAKVRWLHANLERFRPIERYVVENYASFGPNLSDGLEPSTYAYEQFVELIH